MIDHEKRQVFEPPSKLLESTEHRAEIKCCPVSGILVRAEFPEEVKAPAQYGPRFKSILTYLNVQQILPFDRLGQLIQDIFGQPLSQATALGANERIFARLAPFEGKFKKILEQYHGIISKGRIEHPRRQGRDAQSKAANLLDRLEDYDHCVLAFLLDLNVPFTNNQGEQDIRMIKARQKVSGGFRTLHGAQVSLRIRGYISTCRKQGRNILEALERAFLGEPFMPSAAPGGP